MKIGVLLSGCGVYDGSEIHETVFGLLAINQNNAEAVCFAPDIEQHHVVNHISGEEMPEKRNVLVEAARIARGEIQRIDDISVDNFDALFIPGGFGAAKNLTKWAFKGPEGEIVPAVKDIILATVKAGKPLAGVCMGPTVIAKALAGTEYHPKLTVGTTQAPSPYEIDAISKGMESLGATAEMKGVDEITVDEQLKIVTAPCYMMKANIGQIYQNASMTIKKLVELAK